MKKTLFATLSLTAFLTHASFADGCEGWLTFKGNAVIGRIVEKGFSQESDGFWYDGVGGFKFKSTHLKEIEQTHDDLVLRPSTKKDSLVNTNTCQYTLTGKEGKRLGRLNVGRIQEAESAKDAAYQYIGKNPKQEVATAPTPATAPEKKAKKKKGKHVAEAAQPFAFEGNSPIHGALAELWGGVEKTVPGFEAVFTSIKPEDLQTGLALVNAVLGLASTIQKDKNNAGAITNASLGVVTPGSNAFNVLSEKAALFEANRGK